MRRRTILRTVAVSSTLALAGCGNSSLVSTAAESPSESESPEIPGSTTDCTISQSIDGAQPTPVGADGTFEDAEAVVNLRWNARAQRTARESEDAYIGSEADPDQKFIVFRVEVTNPSEAVLTVDDFNFELEYETPDTVGTAASAITGIEELDYRLKSGGTVDGPLLFLVPADAASATLRPAVPNFPDRVPVGFDPTCDRSLDIGIPPL